jgi:hypothetical protein
MKFLETKKKRGDYMRLFLAALGFALCFVACAPKKPTTVVVSPSNLPVTVDPQTLQSVHPEDSVDTTTQGN